jgi:hypothetical protein
MFEELVNIEESFQRRLEKEPLYVGVYEYHH